MKMLKALPPALIATALVLSGCSSTSNASAGGGNSPVKGGTLIFLEHSPKLDHLDPNRIYTGRDLAFMNSFVTRTLVAYNPVPGAAGTLLVPDLATNTGVPTNQAKTWSFTLRSGTKFEDGKAITCADVKYGTSRSFATDIITDGPAYAMQWLDIPKDATGAPIYKGPYVADPVGQAAYDKAVTCDSTGRTITFNLNTSVADFNYFATYGAISPVQKSKDTGDAYDLRPQSTGPYKILSNTKEALTLVRNDKWSQSSDKVRTPYPNRVELRFGIDEQVRDQMMLANSIPNAVNFDNPLPVDRAKFFDVTTGAALPSMAGRAINYSDPYARYLAFNLAKMPCLEVREAMYYARDAKANLDYLGGPAFAGSYATGVISPLLATDFAPTGVAGPGSPDFVPSGNLTKAKALLDLAKTKCPAEYTHATQTGIVIDVAQSATLQDLIPINVAAWARVGIKVSYNIIKSGYYSTVMNPTKQSDLSTSGWGADWANASTVIPQLYLVNGGFDLSQNGGDPNYASFEAKVAVAMRTTNRQAQAKLWKALDKQAMANFWVLPTIFGKAQFVWGSGVGGGFFWVPQGNPAFGKMWVK
ncbi:bacterial extracellular solute-binding protein, family 5 middle [mine drainage metagenome]|uniref:Bacterial extracellular solute-binding protein, family 5 middle n=1 Tax=mine drainage metagenome TaxID=410659 RepID=A0A1J5R4D0_9ZZZZ